MPEVIEVRKYTDFITSNLLDSALINIEILKGRYKTHGPFAHYDTFTRHLPAKLIEINSKGKLMWMKFDNGYIMSVTLGLSGGWFFQAAGKTNAIMMHGLDIYEQQPSRAGRGVSPSVTQKYERDVVSKYIQTATNNINVKFTFDRGNLYFYDQLSFGTISLLTNEEQLEKKLKQLGVDIMDPLTKFEDFLAAIRRPVLASKEIGTAIVNQKYIAGIGNYLRADALWLSKISPFRKVKDISNDELARLFYNCRLMIWGLYNRELGIRMGIIKASDKMPVDFGRVFFAYFEKNDIFGNPIVKEESFEGSQKRFIYWAPAWQH
jgi:formamidopyrimidine-DNA glycosylase